MPLIFDPASGPDANIFPPILRDEFNPARDPPKVQPFLDLNHVEPIVDASSEKVKVSEWR